MLHVKNLSEEDAALAMKDGEFPGRVIRESEKVAVILTQSWCPQWLFMRHWITRGSTGKGHDVTVYLFVYDESSFFHEFLTFKETVFDNDQIPYIRYYKNGVCVATSNYVSQERFFELLQ